MKPEQKSDVLIIDSKMDKKLINKLIKNYTIKKLKKAELKTLKQKLLHPTQSFKPIK
ncbi:hypothetical protein [Persephonella sp. KM09-Lau-8]|uniref:hypothetical protein n=1 Tax=Persephonella sp. KM09-Lau-8 TaxID=1158345 RepID=UPI0012DF24F2|nr:hypothetical protein [Persephonella sp. KM09-Lau-8]